LEYENRCPKGITGVCSQRHRVHIVSKLRYPAFLCGGELLSDIYLREQDAGGDVF
jgi:hypothetical protein